MPKTIGFARHDHQVCIKTAMQAVESRCANEGLKLTPVRRRVMEILLQEHRALGAYDVLECLRDEGLGSQPPVAYRALDFLMANGFAHRVERLNAFIACTSPETRHSPAFLICSECSAVAETGTASITGAVLRAGQEAGFAVDEMVVEAQGRCPACQEPGAT